MFCGWRIGLVTIATACICAGAVQQTASPGTDYNAKFHAWLKTPDKPAKVKPRLIKRDFTWFDATPSIVTRDGVRYRNPEIAPWRFALSASIDEALAQSIEKHFGARIDDIQFGFTSPQEREKCQRLENQKLAHHGMRVTPTPDGSSGVLEPSYQWLVDGCKEQLNPIAVAILRETDRVMKSLSAPRVLNQRDKVAAIFRFIQSIPYQPIDESPDGKDRCGLRTPLITLLKGGDCDSKSALMAALIRSAKIADVVIITLTTIDGGGHAVLGVKTEPRTGDQTITHEGATYVIAEASSDDAAHNGNIADLGEIGDAWKDFRSRPYEVTPVR